MYPITFSLVFYPKFVCFLLQALPSFCSFIGYILNLGIFLYFPIWLLGSTTNSHFINHTSGMTSLWKPNPIKFFFCSQKFSSQDWRSSTVEKRRALSTLVLLRTWVWFLAHTWLLLLDLTPLGFHRHQVQGQFTYIHYTHKHTKLKHIAYKKESSKVCKLWPLTICFSIIPFYIMK